MTETPLQVRLAEWLRDQSRRSLKMEYRVAGWKVDLAYPELKLGIEVDGPYHNKREQQSLDDQKEREIQREGWEVLRVTNDQVDNDLESVGRQILDAAYKRSKKRFAK